jgi:lipopolysaccharide assembly protein A
MLAARCQGAVGLTRMREAIMRWAYLIVIVLFAAAVVVFCVQNRDFVTISFLQFSIRAPLAILAVIVYVLGAATGGSLYALLRRSVRGARRAPQPKIQT